MTKEKKDMNKWGSPWSIFSGAGEGGVEVSSKIRSLFKSSLTTLLCQINPVFASLDDLDLLIRSWSDYQTHPNLSFFLNQKQIVSNQKGNQEICSAEKRLCPDCLESRRDLLRWEEIVPNVKVDLLRWEERAENWASGGRERGRTSPKSSGGFY